MPAIYCYNSKDCPWGKYFYREHAFACLQPITVLRYVALVQREAIILGIMSKKCGVKIALMDRNTFLNVHLKVQYVKFDEINCAICPMNYLYEPSLLIAFFIL